MRESWPRRGSSSRTLRPHEFHAGCPNDSRCTARYPDRGLAAMHRSPGGVTCEASFPARVRRAVSGLRSDPPYTPLHAPLGLHRRAARRLRGDDYVARHPPPPAGRRPAADRATARARHARTRSHGGLVDASDVRPTGRAPARRIAGSRDRSASWSRRPAVAAARSAPFAPPAPTPPERLAPPTIGSGSSSTPRRRRSIRPPRATSAAPPSRPSCSRA